MLRFSSLHLPLMPASIQKCTEDVAVSTQGTVNVLARRRPRRHPHRSPSAKSKCTPKVVQNVR